MNKEELDLLEIVFTLAIGECAYNDINNIQKLEDKIKTINNLCKNQKEAINKITEIINYYGVDKEYNDKAIKQLQQENKILKENAENNDKVVDKVNWENQLLKKENEELKDNWNKLKEWLESNWEESQDIWFVKIINKMQELQGSDK